MTKDIPEFSVGWCHDASDINEASVFFAKHVDSTYISHSELMSARAVDETTWSDNLADVVNAELSESILSEGDSAASKTSKLLLARGQDQQVLGMMIWSFVAEEKAYAVLEDTVVDPDFRGHGIFSEMFNIGVNECKARGVSRLFLESGIGNEGAHKIFERMGFETVSKVMTYKL